MMRSFRQTKRFLITFLALALSLHLAGCSSGDTREEDIAANNDQSYGVEGGEFSEGNELSNELNGDQGLVAEEAPPAEGTAPDELSLDDTGAQGGGNVANNDFGDELTLDDPNQAQGLPEDIAGQQPPVDAAPPTEPPPPAPTDEQLFANNGASNEPPQAPIDVAPPSEEPPTDVAAEPPSAPAPFAPLLKIKDSAFAAKDGSNLNRVYLSRKGDNWKNVSEKLYGEDRTKELKSWNPSFRSRGLRVGDKVYYQSSKEPTDERMLTYYEEAGLPAQTYTTQEGDNIRNVAEQLLGAKDSWKELWSTNSVESKGKLPPNETLRYWPEMTGDSAPASTPAPEQIVADNQPPPLPPSDPGFPPADPGGMMPPPPADPSMTGAAGSMGQPPPSDLSQPPPPPPPPSEAAAPPPPPKRPNVKAAPVGVEGDPDQMMMLGFGGILLVAAAFLFVVIRKNRAKRVDLSQTQV